MLYIKGTEHYTDKSRAAVTLGKFDGLHRGHRKLIEQVTHCAKQESLKSIVYAFDMSPFEKRSGAAAEKLMTGAERRHLLEPEIDYLIECPFTESIQTMAAVEFIEKVLIKILKARHVVVGENFCFGYQRQGNADLLQHFAAEGAFKVTVVPQERYEGRVISSTYIKEVLPTGNMELVNQLLGYPYTMIGEVVQGNQIGRTLGMRTMNIIPDKMKLLPPFGVYLCQVNIDRHWHDGICNIGIRPTIGEYNGVTIESHLFDYNKDAYGQEIEVRLIKRQREEMKFDGISALKEQMKKDIAVGKDFFKLNNN